MILVQNTNAMMNSKISNARLTYTYCTILYNFRKCQAMMAWPLPSCCFWIGGGALMSVPMCCSLTGHHHIIYEVHPPFCLPTYLTSLLHHEHAHISLLQAHLAALLYFVYFTVKPQLSNTSVTPKVKIY